MTREDTSLIPKDPSFLAFLEKYTPKSIESTIDLAEVIKVDNIGLALESMVKMIGGTLTEQNRIAEIRIRAQRRAGEILGQILTRGGDRKSKDRPKSPTLESLGIKKMDSSNWQKIAGLQREFFEKSIEDIKNQRLELTTAGLLKFVGSSNRQAKEESRVPTVGCEPSSFAQDTIIAPYMIKVEQPSENSIADVIVCDIVDIDVEMFDRLAEFTARKLKRGGICLVRADVAQANKIYSALDRHMNYWWTCRLDLPEPHSCVVSRKVESCWQPIIVYYVAPMRPAHKMLRDALDSGSVDAGDSHQSNSHMEYLVERLSKPSDVVADLCFDSGMIGANVRKPEKPPESDDKSSGDGATTVVDFSSGDGPGRNWIIPIRKDNRWKTQ